MNALRVASFSLPYSLLTLIGPAFLPQSALVCAAPRQLGAGKVRPAQPAAHARTIQATESTLKFKVTTRVGYKSSGQETMPEQLVQANVWLRGNRARIETTTGGEATVVLLKPPYVYRLLPASKVGVSWRLTPGGPHAMGNFNPQDLLRDPASVRAALTRGGARKSGTATLGGVLCDVYVTRNFKMPGTTAKAWLRRLDSLPVRLEVSSDFTVVASWSNYERPRGLPASLFEPPPSFKIRMAQGQPPLSGM